MQHSLVTRPLGTKGMNVKILADSKSHLEDITLHFKTRTKCWVGGLGGWGGGGLKDLKRLSGERGTRFRWLLEVIATPSTCILEVRLFVTFSPLSLRALLNQLCYSFSRET